MNNLKWLAEKLALKCLLCAHHGNAILEDDLANSERATYHNRGKGFANLQLTC